MYWRAQHTIQYNTMKSIYSIFFVHGLSWSVRSVKRIKEAAAVCPHLNDVEPHCLSLLARQGFQVRAAVLPYNPRRRSQDVPSSRRMLPLQEGKKANCSAWMDEDGASQPNGQITRVSMKRVGCRPKCGCGLLVLCFVFLA